MNAAYELHIRHADADQRAEFDRALADAGTTPDEAKQASRKAAVLAMGGVIG